MKKHMKKLTAAVMALAMLFSLSVTAFASGDSGNTLPAEQTDSGTVTSQGGLPDDLVSVIMPTASTGGAFSVIFDSYNLIEDTQAARYATDNEGKGVVDFDHDTRFYFKNVTKTPVDTIEKLAVAESGTGGLAIDTEVVKYVKATETSIYVKLNSNNKLDKWYKGTTAAAEVVAADWGTSGDFAKIDKLKDLDPLSGFGLDAIDEINEKDPTVYLRKVGAVADTNSPFNGMIQYTFVSAYSTTTTDVRYAYITETNGVEDNPSKVFSTLGSGTNGPDPVTGATFDEFKYADGTVSLKNAFLTDTNVVYARQRTNKDILSFKKTSVPVKVINKTNVDVGVTMSATLTNLAGGDGSIVSSEQTYVYAKSIKYTPAVAADTTANPPVEAAPAKTQFYSVSDAASQNEQTEIIGGNNGVPVIYMALMGTKKDTNGTTTTETEVMTYDTTDKTAKKATASISAVIAGRDDFYGKTWEGTSSDSGKYVYVLNDASYANRTKDFNYMEFQLTGAIDEDNDAWNTTSTTASPAISVTWKVETKEDVKAPTVALTSTTFRATADWTFAVSKNPALAVLSKATATDAQGVTTEVDASKITNSMKATTGLGNITFGANTFTAKPASVTFTFQHPTKAFCTVEVTVTTA